MMDKENNQVDSPRQEYREPRTRAEIVKAVTEKGPAVESEKKRLVITTATKASFEKIAKSLGVSSGSIQYRILQLFCEEKKATKLNSKVLVKRIKNLSEEQLKIIELICGKQDFTVSHILKMVQSIKRIGNDRLLTLRAFADLEDVGANTLNQFFMNTLLQGSRNELGDQAYEIELHEKMISPDQVNAFYNICDKVAGITSATAIAFLPKIRQLKPQHTQVINAFMKQGVSFGSKPIGDGNILGLINLWLTIPELTDKTRVPRFIKKISSKPDKKKKDFQYLIRSFKEVIEKEKGSSVDNFVGSVRNFFN